ncbi:hypothetical protein AMK59_194, partial [Oryctes borbonicus]
MLKQIGSYLLTIRNVQFLNEVRYKRSVGKRLFKKRTTVNPGIQRQSELLNDKFDPSDVDDLQSLESDFMNVGSTYNEHLQQIGTLKEQEKRLIVKHKYFKQVYPNFLTWDDKKHIQYLHKTNPDEWTIEKLSDGFPALPVTIKKIVKATWTKTNQLKIKNHDNSVRKNWEMLKNGQLNLPPILTKHLHKFTDRNFNQIENKVIGEEVIVTKLEPISNGEFSEIIRSYKRLKNKQTSNENKTQSSQNNTIKKQKKEMHLTSDNVSQTNHTTLGSLKASLRTDVTLGKEIEEDERMLLKSSNSEVVTRNEPEHQIIDLEKVPKTTYISTSTKSEKDNKHLIYPEKIIIPRNKLKRGCMYKLYDCYYD